MTKLAKTTIPRFLVTIAGAMLALAGNAEPATAGSDETLLQKLKQFHGRIVCESFHEGNWELFMVNADGSNPVNLTRTPDIDELYPHVSPDGTKICFLVDSGTGAAKVRSVYYMSLDGSHRTLVAHNARWPCWKRDGTAIAYVKAEDNQFSYRDGATEGLVVYNLKTAEHREHPNKELRHLYCLCWSPDSRWFLATVHGGMGFRHTILAIEANGTRVYDLKLKGCRPDISPDGKKVAWGCSDWTMAVADLDLTGREPKVSNQRDVVTSSKPMMIYHMDWSPDSKYIAFSRGPKTKVLGRHPAIVGVRVNGWDLCVADANATDRWTPLHLSGLCNKEPDWIPLQKRQP